MSAAPRANSSSAADEFRTHHNPWAIAFTVTLATFMEILDTSVANVSLPSIAGSLSADYDQSTWRLPSYLRANAVVLPMRRCIADLMCRKRLYLTRVPLL